MPSTPVHSSAEVYRVTTPDGQVHLYTDRAQAENNAKGPGDKLEKMTYTPLPASKQQLEQLAEEIKKNIEDLKALSNFATTKQAHGANQAAIKLQNDWSSDQTRKTSNNPDLKLYSDSLERQKKVLALVDLTKLGASSQDSKTTEKTIKDSASAVSDLISLLPASTKAKFYGALANLASATAGQAEGIKSIQKGDAGSQVKGLIQIIDSNSKLTQGVSDAINSINSFLKSNTSKLSDDIALATNTLSGVAKTVSFLTSVALTAFQLGEAVSELDANNSPEVQAKAAKNAGVSGATLAQGGFETVAFFGNLFKANPWNIPFGALGLGQLIAGFSIMALDYLNYMIANGSPSQQQIAYDSLLKGNFAS